MRDQLGFQEEGRDAGSMSWRQAGGGGGWLGDDGEYCKNQKEKREARSEGQMAGDEDTLTGRRRAVEGVWQSQRDDGVIY